MTELFDKVKQEIGKSFSAVGIKSKEVLESLKLKKQVETLNEQISSATAELGQLIYSMSGAGNLDQVKITEKCEAITALNEQLAEKEAELSQLHLETGEALGKIYCTQCKTELGEDSQFCSHCGEKVLKPTEISTE